METNGTVTVSSVPLPLTLKQSRHPVNTLCVVQLYADQIELKYELLSYIGIQIRIFKITYERDLDVRSTLLRRKFRKKVRTAANCTFKSAGASKKICQQRPPPDPHKNNSANLWVAMTTCSDARTYLLLQVLTASPPIR